MREPVPNPARPSSRLAARPGSSTWQFDLAARPGSPGDGPKVPAAGDLGPDRSRTTLFTIVGVKLLPLAASTLAAALVLTACGNGGESGSPDPSPSSSTSGLPSTSSAPSSTTTSTSTPPEQRKVTRAVYYYVDTRTGFRLVRELREVPADGAAQAAVEAMIAGANDPDYATSWNPDTQVLSVRRAGNAIKVDLSADARTANAGSEVAGLMVQQLVYTASSALGPRLPVQLLIEGRPAGELWGVLSWTGPERRAAPVDVRNLVQIDTPADGATVSSPVTVRGDAAVFEATLPWRVLDSDGKVVKEGTAMTTEGQRFAPYSFRVRLPAGDYVIEVREDDPSGGEGGPVMTDTRSITVEPGTR